MSKDAIEDSDCIERTQSSLDLYLDGWKGGVMTDMQWCFENSEEAAELINELQQRLAEAESKTVELEKELFILASDVIYCGCGHVTSGLQEKAKRIYGKLRESG